VYRVPICLAAQSFAESSSRQRDRREGLGGRGLHEELSALHEVSRDGATRINSATRPILVNETHRELTKAMCETFDGEREPANRILAQGLRRIAAGTPHKELDMCIHGIASLAVSERSNAATTERLKPGHCR
jgi:hypothetical protein